MASAYLITIVSPLKVLNAEIVSRAQPTLIDIIVALAAGAVAALAVAKKNISSNIAGVAIASSLMPPLCVAGIGFALLSFPIAIGGLMLFIANAVSIVFAGIFVFRIIGIHSQAQQGLQKKSIVFVSIMLAITALPLFFFLRSYTFESQAYQKTETILTSALKEISPGIFIENVQTRIEISPETSGKAVFVEADILIPEDITINFQQRELLIDSLKAEFSLPVILTMRIQQSIALQTESDIAVKRIKEILTSTVKEQIKQVNKGLTIDSITLFDNKDENKEQSHWNVDVVLRSDPSIIFTENQRATIETILIEKTSQDVELNIEIISRITLKAEPELALETMKQEIKAYLLTEYSDGNSTEIDIIQTPSHNYVISLFMTVPRGKEVPKKVIEVLQDRLEKVYKADFSIHVQTVERREYLF
jgi:uncharacterized membrane protein